MLNNDLPEFPCPVCGDCDHDLRGGLLEFINNIGENLKHAGEMLLDAVEAPTESDDEQFKNAMTELATVRRQVSMLLETIPDIALIKMVSDQ